MDSFNAMEPLPPAFAPPCIYKRNFGWTENGKKVATITWTRVYDETLNDYRWEKANAPTSM